MDTDPLPPSPPPGRRVALVTGAARGIGLAVCRHLAARGDIVHATWRSTEPPAVEGVRFHRSDIVEPGALEAVIAEAEAADGPIDIAVGNAAILRDGMSFRMSDEQFLEVLHVDLEGNMRLASRVLPGMAARGWGRVVFVSSVGGITGSSSQVNYATAKAALHGLARSAALEVAADGVTVNVVAPGPIDTELMRGMGEKHFAAFSAVVPAGRMGRVDEVADLVGFLASDHAAFITGVVIPIDGGLLLSDGFLRSNRERVLMARRSLEGDGGGGTG